MRRFYIPVASAALVLSFAGVVWWIGGVPFWGAILISAGAIAVNGLIATVEDDAPGGFNNPDGRSTPAYVGRLGLVGRIAFGLVTALAASVLASGSARLGELTPHKPVFWAIAALSFAAVAIVVRKTRRVLVPLAVASLLACVLLTYLQRSSAR